MSIAILYHITINYAINKGKAIKDNLKRFNTRGIGLAKARLGRLLLPSESGVNGSSVQKHYKLIKLVLIL